ncbi:MAG: exodeoxyribonuclease VII large subunit [Rhodospirillaceae bacterium]|nr:exodeoxyribonuclease VII large subunit [Rhodospirillaceae bacterium]
MSEHPNSADFTENDPKSTGGDDGIYSVGEISSLIRQTLEDEFPYVRVRGEISGFTRAGSGHLYFSLKDEKDALDGVCWRGAAGKLKIRPEDGMEIIATGRLTAYGPRSRYQMVVEQMEIAGEGALLKLLEDRKKKLAREGLFDEERKQETPYLPRVIGVVTSPTGAVIRDILHRLADRFPVHVLVWPVLVQGDGAPEQIASAIAGFDKISGSGNVPRPDLLIVARGGGSIEDLWAFNEEVVVRAVADCTIPLISAVGHETDTTLIDYVSDLRAPTPTAAAEMAVPVKSELMAGVMDESARLMRFATRITTGRKNALAGIVRGLPDLVGVLGTASHRLDDWSARLDGSLKNGVERRLRKLAERAGGLVNPRNRLAYARSRLEQGNLRLRRGGEKYISTKRETILQSGRLLDGFSYQRVLERGFVLLQDNNGNAVTRAAKLKTGDDVTLQMADGTVGARITDGKPERTQQKTKTAKTDARQGKLL